MGAPSRSPRLPAPGGGALPGRMGIDRTHRRESPSDETAKSGATGAAPLLVCARWHCRVRGLHLGPSMISQEGRSFEARPVRRYSAWRMMAHSKLSLCRLKDSGAAGTREPSHTNHAWPCHGPHRAARLCCQHLVGARTHWMRPLARCLLANDDKLECHPVRMGLRCKMASSLETSPVLQSPSWGTQPGDDRQHCTTLWAILFCPPPRGLEETS